MSQFYIILCVSVYLDIRINKIFIFQSRSPSNQRESNKGQITKQNTAQQKHILKIVFWIRMSTVYQHNNTISLEFATFVSFGKSKINSIHNVCSYQLDTNSGNAFKWNQNVIIWYSLKKNVSSMFTMMHYSKCSDSIHNMSQFYDIDDAIHNLHLVKATVFITNKITHQIEILIVIAICVIVSTIIYCYSSYRSTNTLNLFLFYMITSNTGNIISCQS